MFVNIVQNSDSKQCTESRLGQVHSVHTPMAQAVRTLRPGPAMSWHTRRCVVASPGRIVAFLSTVLQRAQAVSQAVSRAVSSRASCAVSWRIAEPYRSPGLLYRTQSRPPQQRYNFCIVTHSWPGRTRVHCHTPLRAAGRVVAHADRIVAHARTCHG